VYCFNPATAFTYTTTGQDFFTNVTEYQFKSVYVYAGDVELYCRGSAGSSPSTPCVFSGLNVNAFVYYTPMSQQVALKYKSAGLSVYLNFDGRIGEYVPNFGLLTTEEMQSLAAATAGHVCGESNAIGMGWDVEPFNNNQLPFFQELDKLITACKKTWGVFTFADAFSEEMWTSGLGTSGILLDSTYDLSCSTCAPCKCVPPTPKDASQGNDNYASVLTQHLQHLKVSTTKYNKPYQLFIAGSGTTQIYEICVLVDCSSMGGGQVFNQTCPWKMADWGQVWVDTVGTLGLNTDKNFMGVAVYDWAVGSNGGFLPNEPEQDFIVVLKKAGYM